jgi:glucan phosphoethanolaminetransferase (alkaline phosphatase superfamily)
MNRKHPRKRLKINSNELAKLVMLAIIMIPPIIFFPQAYGGSELPKLAFLHILIFIVLVIFLLTKRTITFSMPFIPILAIFLLLFWQHCFLSCLLSV